MAIEMRTPEETEIVGESPKSRFERFREWREARAGHRFAKRKLKLEREAELAKRELPLEESRAQLAELQARTARAKAKARIAGPAGKFGGISSILSSAGERASQAQATIFGETGREFGQAQRASKAAPASIFGAPSTAAKQIQIPTIFGPLAKRRERRKKRR